MNTLKTTFVVIVLLAVLYGVYVVLNKPEPQPTTDAGSPWQQGAPKTPRISTGELDATGGLAPPSETQQANHIVDLAPRQNGDASKAAEYIINDQGIGPRSQLNPPPPLHSPEAGAGSGAVDPPSYYGQIAKEARGAGTGAGTGPTPSTPEAGDLPAGSNAPGGAVSGRNLGSSAFEAYWRKADQQIKQGQFREALETLSPFYGSSDLTDNDQQKLLNLLDPLAGKVIYSTEHLMEPPYTPRRGETLKDIAVAYDVPWELLRNINGVEDPLALPPGKPLKVVRGPFRAEVVLDKRQLTLFVANLYAGRFDIEVHRQDVLMKGNLHVQRRKEWPDFEADGHVIPSSHPDNPYGRWLLDLGSGIRIHSSTPSPAASALGCISLSPQDASDVFAILSVGSQVEIHR